MKTTVGEMRERSSKVFDSLEDIFDVRVQKFEGDSKHPLVSGPFDVSVVLAVQGERSGEQIDVIAKYRLLASTGGENPVTAWSLRLTMIASWAISEQRDLDVRDLNSFAVATGALVIHPYAREAAQSLIGRMGYPPFTMGMIYSPLNAPDDYEYDLDEAGEDEVPTPAPSP